jgi:WD40 repeat protein
VAGVVGARVVPDACPAVVSVLATALGGDGRWHALSAGGHWARCWLADAADLAGVPSCEVGRWTGISALALAVMPDGTDIIVGRNPGDYLMRWDRVSGQPLGDPVSHPGPGSRSTARPLTVAGTPDGPVAATGSGGSLWLWDVASGRPTQEVACPGAAPVLALTAGELDDGSQVVVSAGLDGCIRRWDPETGAERGDPITQAGRGVAIAVARLRDGQRVVCSLTGKGNVVRRDLLTGEPLGPPIATGWQPGRVGKVCTHGQLSMAVTPTGAVVATRTDNRGVLLWDLVSGDQVGELGGSADRHLYRPAVAYLPDDAPFFLACDPGGKVRRFDPLAGTELGAAVIPHGMTACSVRPVQAPDRLLLVVEGNATVRIFDAATGTAMGEVIQASLGGPSTVTLAGGRMVLAVGDGDRITWHEVPSGVTYPYQSSAGNVFATAAAALPDGRTVVAGAGHLLEMPRWDAATGQPFGELLPGRGGCLTHVAAARQADGRPMFIGGTEDGDLFRWDAETGQPVDPPLPGVRGQVWDLVTVDLPDGRQVLVGLGDDSICRWDPVTGRSREARCPGKWGRFVAAHVDADGVPYAFALVDDRGEAGEARRVERWRLDILAKTGPDLPSALCAVYDADGTTWMVLAEADGSLVITPLPPVPAADPGLIQF